MLKAKFSIKFYIVAILLLAMVIFGWYGIYFLNANEILTEDNTAMDSDYKLIFTVLFSLIVSTWSLSLVTVIRQMILGCAFRMDENGIHDTATGIVIFSLIIIVPVKSIPYEAIQQLTTEEDGGLTIRLDKSKLQISPLFKLFARKEYHFFSALTKEKSENIKKTLNRFMKK